ncbi:MAG: hypothetical protein ACREQ4_14705 [Candidatus Binataceae bacterium]
MVLHALNQRFFINEKNVFIDSKHFRLQPNNLHREIERVLGSIGTSPQELTRSVAAIHALIVDLCRFCTEQFSAALD